ncbi:MAG: hypothetical protein Q8P18_21890 [Pseudomonadota bacterium]|nr:hypothetical protein [Pseudomonadota bacterium]
MTSEQWVALLHARVAGRFEFEGDEVGCVTLRKLAPPHLEDAAVVRLRRAAASGHRTVLVVSCDNGGIGNALRWAASVRDALPEPEPADLYLILDAPCAVEVGARLEADDRFCRRFVIREKESPEELLERTFLRGTRVDASANAPHEPLAAALASVPGIGLSLAASWRVALLGGATGTDLFELLLAAAPAEAQQ